MLDALTAAEHARFVNGTTFGRQQVEPMTNYFISRGTKEIGDVTTTLLSDAEPATGVISAALPRLRLAYNTNGLAHHRLAGRR